MRLALITSILIASILILTVQAQPRLQGTTFIGNFAHAEIGTIRLYKDTSGTSAILFASQMQVNTDGAPDSYHPDNIGITHICNGVSVGVRGGSCTWKANCIADFNRAKAEGFRGPTKICFFAMVASSSGIPVIQSDRDPKPGYYVSTTAFKQPDAPLNTPQAQLDSNEIPFVVIPSRWSRDGFQGLGLGDFAVTLRKSNGRIAYAMIGDVGPANKLGEGSVEMHENLGNDPFIMRFGVRRALRGITAGGRDVVYALFPGSRTRGVRMTKELIEREGKRLLEQLGGEARLRELARGL